MAKTYTVILRATETYAGQEYSVRIEDDGSERVWTVIHKNPVSARGCYQCDTVLRSIKQGSANHKAAVRAALAQVER